MTRLALLPPVPAGTCRCGGPVVEDCGPWGATDVEGRPVVGLRHRCEACGTVTPAPGLVLEVSR